MKISILKMIAGVFLAISLLMITMAANSMADLSKARALASRGDLDGSAVAYEKHHQQSEADQSTLLEHSRVEAWRGDHARSMELLDQYREKFGEDHDSRQDTARLLAWAQRPYASLAILSELLKNDPNDFNARFTRAIALRNDHRPAEALALSEKLQEEAPSKDTEDLFLAAWTPVRSKIGSSLSFYADADDLNHLHTELFGYHFLSPATSLGVKLEYDHLSAEIGSGLENIDGTEAVDHYRLAIEISHRFTSWLGAGFSLGGSETDDHDEFPACRLDINLNPADGLALRLSHQYGYYLVSPRSVSLDIRNSHYQLDLSWRPDLRYTIIAQIAYDDITDDNSKWTAILAPRRAFVRSQYFNLDLGLRVWLFGFDRDLNNGYYDPDEYESYMATVFSNWQLNQNNSIGLRAAAGMVKDNTISSFEFGWEATLEGKFGLYRNWMLKVYLSTMNNQRQAGGGAFDAHSGGLTLIRRF